MDEIPDPLKKILVINAIIAIIFGFIYIEPIHLILLLLDLPAFDPLYSWVFGGTLLILGIFAWIVVNRKDSKQIRLILELLIVWEIMIVFMNVIIGFRYFSIVLPVTIVWLNNAIFLVMIVINVYFYRKYRE